MPNNTDLLILKLEQMSEYVHSLYLKVREGEVEVGKISLLEIIEEFLSNLLLAHRESINLEIVANFLIALSELILWKSSMLLPCSFEESVEENEADTSFLEHNYWLEYKKYQALVKVFAEKEFKQSKIYLPSLSFSASADEFLVENDHSELILAFEEILSKNKHQKVINYKHNEYNIEKKMQEIEENISRSKNRLTFSQIIAKGSSRIEIIVIFLALLQLICQNRVDYSQSGNFAEITFYRKEDERLKKQKIQRI